MESQNKKKKTEKNEILKKTKKYLEQKKNSKE